MRIYQINVKYACFGIVEDRGRVIESAPIANWTIGKNIEYVISYFTKKGAIIKIVETEIWELS